MATDFSPTAQHASRYALALAESQGARVELIHAYMLPFAYADTTMPIISLEEVQAISENSMNTELGRLGAAFPNVSLTARSVPGDLPEVLNERIGQLAPDLVVLGNSGVGGGAFWGSMAVKIMRTSSVPVLVVPELASWRDVERICFAADYKEDGALAPLQTLHRWVQRLRSELYVLNVSEPEAPVLEVPVALKSQFADLNARFFSQSATDLESTIHDFIGLNQIDWLVVIPRKYGFLERLFHRSTTKQLTLGSAVPVLALHEADT